MVNLMRIWKDSVSGEMKEKKECSFDEPSNLVFDPDTRTIYYKFSERVAVKMIGDKEITGRVGFMSPYISNGKFCRFIDGKIVEID